MRWHDPQFQTPTIEICIRAGRVNLHRYCAVHRLRARARARTSERVVEIRQTIPTSLSGILLSPGNRLCANSTLKWH